ncbi:MAG: hypothetical protein M1832_002503 [Thelocarpon impressellum]|nr:MAG: hypothetical protein M1832_002503 [Thelocarpon impressellum]
MASPDPPLAPLPPAPPPPATPPAPPPPATPAAAPSAFAFLPRGATLHRFSVAGRNIVLGFPSPADYAEHNSPYFGETIGRVANRIRGARIDNLNGRSHRLPANNPPSSLHGGLHGWGKKAWRGPEPGLLRGSEAATFRYRSPDGDEGYPGTVDVSATYAGRTRWHEGTEKLELELELEVRMPDEQRPGVDETAVNVTNHTYFNLGDGPTVAGTEATLSTDLALPLDADGIPRSGPSPHDLIRAGQTFTLGESGPALDDCFVLHAEPSTVPLDTRAAPLRTAATFHHPSTQLHLEVRTTEPAFQFYTGEHVDVPAVGAAPARRSRAGFCVEPGRYVDAVNVPEWRGMVVLRRGQVYGSRIVYTAWRA